MNILPFPKAQLPLESLPKFIREVADVSAGLWVFEHFKGVPAIPAEGQGGDDEKSWARWRKWLKAVESRESVTNTMSEREYYLPIYERYHNDSAQ